MREGHLTILRLVRIKRCAHWRIAFSRLVGRHLVAGEPLELLQQLRLLRPARRLGVLVQQVAQGVVQGHGDVVTDVAYVQRRQLRLQLSSTAGSLLRETEPSQRGRHKNGVVVGLKRRRASVCALCGGGLG